VSFVIREIHMTLDPASIEKAIQEIETIREKIIPAAEKLVAELTMKGVEIARAVIMEYDPPIYESGYLAESLVGQAEGTSGTISTNAPYAMYVEYGTGSVGQGGSSVGTYTQTGWVYYDDYVGQFFYTEGMAARPFMYDTFRELEAEAEKNGGRIIAEYLR